MERIDEVTSSSKNANDILNDYIQCPTQHNRNGRIACLANLIDYINEFDGERSKRAQEVRDMISAQEDLEDKSLLVNLLQSALKQHNIS